MGITGLLPLLKKASKKSHVRNLSGLTVAIDAYCWLHKGAFGCADKLGKGEPTTAYINYCLKYINLLLEHNVKPILVLDGRNLPSKAHTEKKRREKREENRKLARKYLQEGKKKEAWECFTKCVDITPAMAREFIKVLRSMKIDYVVAPYEADAQLAYLAKTGLADVIITEDSDLVLFGCPKIFFKMNIAGDGILYDEAKLPQCWGIAPNKFKFEHFRWMCILSGCDYLSSIPGVGLGRAKKIIQAADHDNIKKMIKSIPSVLDKIQIEITDEYIDGFLQAENTFLYQLVYDTVIRQLIPLNPYPENLDPQQLEYAGCYENDKMALEMALGNIDIHTLKTVDHFDPMQSGYEESSIWSPSFEVGKLKSARKSVSATLNGNVAMEFSISNKSFVKQKQHLGLNGLSALTNLENADSISGDYDLMNLYGYKSSLATNAAIQSRDSKLMNCSVIIKDCLKQKQEVEEVSYSSFNRKRRRETEDSSEIEDTPNNNTNSRSRKVPFRKSPQKSNVHVKSKYFRSEASSSTKVVITKTENILSEEMNSSSDDLANDVIVNDYLEKKLNIYSYESSSQETEYDDISASSQQVMSESQKAQVSEIMNLTEYPKRNVSISSITVIAGASIAPNANTTSGEGIGRKEDKPESTTEIEPITLDEDNDDEACSSSSQSNSTNYSLRSTASPSSTQSSYTSSPYFSASQFNEKKSTTRKTPPSKSAYVIRRVGLSRTVKRDPKQPTLKDMLVKQHVKN